MLSDIKSREEFLNSLPSGVEYSKDIALKDYLKIEEKIRKVSLLFSQFKDSIPPVINTILSPEVLVSKKRGIVEREDNARELILNNRKTIDGARVQIESRESDILSLQTTISSLKELIGSLRASIENNKETIKRLSDTILKRELDLQDERDGSEIAKKRLYEVAERINSKNEEKTKAENSIVSLKKELEETNKELGEQYKSLNDKRQEKEALLARINEEEKKAVAASMYIESINNEIQTVFTTFFETYARNLNEFEDRLTPDLKDETTLKAEFDSVNQEIKSLGNINHAAKDEFDQAEDQYKFYSKQLDD